MSARYEVRVYNNRGELQTVFSHWRTLSVERRINNFDTHTFSFDDDRQFSKLDAFDLDGFVEVWRYDPINGIAPYIEYQGFHRSPNINGPTQGGYHISTSYGRGMLDLLRRRIIAYPANSVGADKAGAGETVIKAYVDENAGSLATTTNGRLYDGVFEGFTTQLDGGHGVFWKGQRPYANLLDVMQDVCVGAGFDAGVVWLGGRHFEFRTYFPQLGTDRTSGSVARVFSAEFANIIDPNYIQSRTEEATAVIVLGQGQESNRQTVRRVSSAYLHSPWNLIEVQREGSRESTVQGLNTIGDAALEVLQFDDHLTFTVLQTPACIYGRDYFLGDIVTLKMGNIVKNKQIVGVNITVAEGKETITVDFGDRQKDITRNPFNHALSNIVGRLQIVESQERSEQTGAVRSVAYSDLPTPGQPGRTFFCRDCVKDGEAPLAGTGTVVYDDGSNWRRVADDTTAST